MEVVDVGIDFSRIPGLKNGDPVTLQVVETSLDGVKYACIDLTVTGLTGAADPNPSEPNTITHSDHDYGSMTTSVMPMTESTTAPSATTTSAAVGVSFSLFLFAMVFAF